MEDFFAAYLAARTDGDEPDWREMRPELLRQRGDFRSLNEEVAAQQPQRGSKLREAIRFLSQHPAPLAAPPSQSRSPGADFDGRVSRDMGPEVLRGLRRAAASQQATLNDLLMRDLFLTLRDWNRQHGAKRAGEWLRLLMPCNLREREFQSMPGANRMGYSFLTRSIGDCDSPRELLAGIRAETDQIRCQRRYLQWMRGLELAKASRIGMPLMTRASRCFSTAVLTNLGDPLRAFVPAALRQRGKLDLGDVRLEKIYAHTPLRPKTRAGFCVTTYAGSLAISATCDPYCFSVEAAEDLLFSYGERLRATSEAPPVQQG
jgi:hypothetical protein